MILSTLSNILVKERSHINLSSKESFLGVASLLIRHTRLLMEEIDNVLLLVGGIRSILCSLGNECLIHHLQALVLGEFFIILVPNGLKLLLFLTILINLLLELVFQLHNLFLQLLDLRLLEVELFTFNNLT